MTILGVSGLTKRFGTNTVIAGIDLDVKKGERIAVLGASGSGKSTLLRCINMLEVPDTGSVAINGEEIKLKPRRGGGREPADRHQIDRLRQQLGMVFQSFNLWSHLTVLENVIEAPLHVQHRLRAEVLVEARHILAKVGMAEKADAYPSQISGGQQQRAAIARALAMRPKAMLFDEPTSSLDPELTDEVLVVMRELAADGTTMIVVTHEMSFAREASDRVLFLHNGLIEEEGPPAQVFGSPKSDRCRQFLSKHMQ
jgi:octopine/nopaline transport system ATP-binding protein